MLAFIALNPKGNIDAKSQVLHSLDSLQDFAFLVIFSF